MTDPERMFELRDVPPDHPGLQVAMPLLSYHDGEWRCMGTGFAVAPGLAITAAHVAREWRPASESPEGTGAAPVEALQWFNGRWHRWIGKSFHACYASDIAFIVFQRPGWWGDGPGQSIPRCARLNYNPPEVGDSLRIVGFPRPSIKETTLVTPFCESQVRVTEVHLRSTRGKMMPQSHIDVEGRTAPGMSGGPCFNKNWDVVGVHSLGWEMPAGVPPLAHVALPWPAMSTEIEYFSTGKFPAADLFQSGPARALGYRRLHLTSSGEVLLGTIDPDSLEPMHWEQDYKGCLAAVNYCGGEAEQALVAMREHVIGAMDGSAPLISNVLHRHLRTFFWELAATLRITIHAAAIRCGIEDHSGDWDRLYDAWKQRSLDPKILDDCARVNFAWHGAGLYEVLTYAQLCSAGMLTIQSITGKNRTASAVLESSRVRGPQRFLPDGLDTYLSEARKFVPKVLDLAERVQSLTSK